MLSQHRFEAEARGSVLGEHPTGLECGWGRFDSIQARRPDLRGRAGSGVLGRRFGPGDRLRGRPGDDPADQAAAEFDDATAEHHEHARDRGDHGGHGHHRLGADVGKEHFGDLG